MKKTPLLQSDLSFTIARLGHMDMLVIADAGLPIPAGTLRIDLALTKGVPVEFVTHSELKSRTADARAVVRTGEFSPYANVILVSGVVF